MKVHTQTPAVDVPLKQLCFVWGPVHLPPAAQLTDAQVTEKESPEGSCARIKWSHFGTFSETVDWKQNQSENNVSAFSAI